MYENNAFALSDATVTVTNDDQGRPTVQVTFQFGAQEVSFFVHQSLVFADTVNIELDGSYDAGDSAPAHLRVNLNDGLIYDSTLGLPALPDDREPELADEEEETEEDSEAFELHTVNGDYSDVQ